MLIAPGPPNGPRGAMLSIMKLIYEFWGFCVNGGNSLRQPGGFATSQTLGSYLNMPVGFESGSILLASGSDGFTSQGNPYFSAISTPFAPTHVGMYLVTWVSGSTSTDDSIYRITRWLNSSSIVVDPSTGGTPLPPQPNITGSFPTFTARSSVNYRVVDIAGTGGLAAATGQYMVLQFNNANSINPGQVNSQFKLTGQSGNDVNTNLTVTLSPSGSWNGTSFANESYPEFGGEQSNSGPGGGGWGSPDWFHNSGGGRGRVSLWGGTGFIMCAAGGEDWTSEFPGNGSLIHIEIPLRLYPQASDPNPICGVNQGNLGINTNGQTGFSYGMRWFPSPYDTLQRRWATAVRCFGGATWHNTTWNQAIQNGQVNRYPELNYNRLSNKFVSADGILCQVAVNTQATPTGQYSLARARLRTVRFTAGGYPYWMRAGDPGNQWIHIGAGVLWPWDGACLSRPLLRGF